MLSFRKHLIICIGFFAALIVVPTLGSALGAAGLLGPPDSVKLPFLILIFGIFLGFGFSAVPVMVMLALGFQRRIGNQDVPVVASVLRAEKTIIWVLWGLMATGTIIAIPAAIQGGLFSPQ